VIDKLSIRPKMTALLLMDFQRMVVDSYAVDKEALSSTRRGAQSSSSMIGLDFGIVTVPRW
jgi:hypothetical protein